MKTRRSAGSAQGGLSRPPLQRMMLLHERLKGEAYPNCRKLADELEVSSKTVQRDIDFMRDRLGLPIDYDQKRFGFYYTEPVTNFPTVEVSEGEIVALFLAQKALAQYKGTSFERPLQTAFQKIAAGLQERIAFKWDSVASAISFRGIGASVADIDLFETTSKAVLHSTELVFQYKGLNSQRYQPRRVQPYHLGYVENQWYLFAHDLDRQQMRTFALPRMREPKDTSVKFRRPADFSIGKYLSRSFAVFSSEGSHVIRIRFDKFASRLVGEHRWHASQRIKQLQNGGLELILTLGSLEEIRPWILSWGEHARVLEPPALVERIRATTHRLAKLYREKLKP